jgi:hemoglobin
VRIVPLLAFTAPGLSHAALTGHDGAIRAYRTCMNPNTPSLYERLGGETMISALIPAFYVRVLADTELGPFFKHTELEKLHAMQREFFVMATGGPIEYSGRPLAHTHHGRGITRHHFARFTTHLVETLLDMGVTQQETDEVIDRINAMTNEIVGASY